jgi:hypothetical protein
LLSITAQPAHALRAATRARFDSTVSFAAIGRQFTSAYEHVIEARRSNGA